MLFFVLVKIYNFLMIAQFTSQMHVLQHKLSRLTEQLHVLSLLCVGDYVEVTRVIADRTVVVCGYVRYKDADAISLEIADGSLLVI